MSSMTSRSKRRRLQPRDTSPIGSLETTSLAQVDLLWIDPFALPGKELERRMMRKRKTTTRRRKMMTNLILSLTIQCIH
jgi:hypothetical protein